MKKALPTIITGFLLITLLDILGSIASRQMNFNYGYLLPFSFLIYTFIPFIIAKNFDKKTGIISAGLLGLFDATIGWEFSMLLQANTGSSRLNITPAVFIMNILFMILISTLLGLLGSWLALSSSMNRKTK